MQSYREYHQFYLLGRFGDKRPTLNSIILSRYGFDLAVKIEKYDDLINQLPTCNIHHRINWRQAAANKLVDWPQQSARLNKMWRKWR